MGLVEHHYDSAQRDAVAGWLREGLTAAQIAYRFSMWFRPVTRNGIISLVARTPALKAIGFARSSGSRTVNVPKKVDRAPSATPRSGVDRAKPGTEGGAVAAKTPPSVTPCGRDTSPPDGVADGRQAFDRRAVFVRRTAQEMVDCVGTPLSPFAPAGGKSLLEIEAKECRFPVDARPADDGAVTTFFCAAPIAREAWMPGRSMGCYCDFHRRFLAGCASVNEGGDVMRRQPALGLVGSAP